MDRWTGVLKVTLNPNNTAPFFNVAASLLFSPSSKTLIAPSLNAIFFNGDRVQGTRCPTIERLSDSKYIAKLIASKFGSDTNAWVLDAARFNGGFAVYKELVPSVDSTGNPRCYDADGFPASMNIGKILVECIEQVRSLLSNRPTESGEATAISSLLRSPAAPPKTIILGFSKGGIVINQIMAELADFKSHKNLHENQNYICPMSKDEILSSISEIHYVDVGLNSSGAYLTDKTIIKAAVENLLTHHDRIRFMLHGTPRQWCDKNRFWIREEKDLLLQLLEGEARRWEGKLQHQRDQKSVCPLVLSHNHSRSKWRWRPLQSLATFCFLVSYWISSGKEILII